MSRLYAKPMPLGTWLLWFLWIAILASAVWVSLNAHESRKLLNELYGEYKVRDNAQAEWGRLMLEQSTWTAHNRIEKLAVEHLDMHMPEANEIRMVRP